MYQRRKKLASGGGGVGVGGWGVGGLSLSVLLRAQNP